MPSRWSVLCCTRASLECKFLRDSNTLRNDGLAVAGLFALDRVLNGKDMFAAKLPRFKVWTSAMRLLRVRIDRVLLGASLRRDYPSIALAGEF